MGASCDSRHDAVSVAGSAQQRTAHSSTHLARRVFGGDGVRLRLAEHQAATNDARSLNLVNGCFGEVAGVLPGVAFELCEQAGEDAS
jgi:hypothetical protein